MKIQSQEKYIMKIRTQRGVLSRKAISNRIDMCAPPSDSYLNETLCQNERAALCALKGSLTAEAAMIVPFVLMIFLSFFSFFSQYASAAAAQKAAAEEAMRSGIALGKMQTADGTEIVIYHTEQTEKIPFLQNTTVTEKAVCRSWVGFTKLETQETYVYITPEGSVYHLNADCTHLKLSVQQVTLQKALASKNEYGETYDQCERCGKNFGAFVYITSEGSRYHAERDCSGLKRTVRQVPLSSVQGRRSCLRCMSREEP